VTAAESLAPEPLLRVTDLVKHFDITVPGIVSRKVGTVQAVDGVSFEVYPGETLGLVGESGCGKSTTARMILRLIEPTSGTVEFEGRNIFELGREEMRALRREMQIVFQDPYASLNPRMIVRDIVGEGFKIWHEEMGYESRVAELLEVVGLNATFASRYPHEFSGGQRQRIGVARALALNPKLVVLDEPVSALDVSVQAQVLNLLDDLQDEFNLTMILIAHDLSVVRHICDRVAVMHLGRIVEVGTRDQIFNEPHHPYTQALLSAVPVPDPDVEKTRQRIPVVGEVPSPINPPSGCRFRTRCWKAQEVCAEVDPPLRDPDIGHEVACHFPSLIEVV